MDFNNGVQKNVASLIIQKMNRTNIYQLLRREAAGLTKQDIVQRLGLSLPTITNNLSELREEGLVTENGVATHTGGRRAKTWSFTRDARAAIGLDITGGYVIAAAIDLAGNVVNHTRMDIEFQMNSAYYQKLGELVRTVIKSAGLDDKHILGVGIGVPGLVTGDMETVFYGEILKFTGASREEFSQYIPFRTALFNDASAAGLGEFWIRNNIGNMFYISLSNNVGGALMIENKIIYGANYHAAEIGHLTLHPGGELCYCGQRGCAETYLAASTLTRACGGSLADFFKLLEQGAKDALAAWNIYLDNLALAVNNVQELFDCTVILGGYITEYINPHLPELKRRAGALNSFEHGNAAYIDICRYKTLSIAAGAALYYICEFTNNV
ncbi:MAG: ROK family transcriptional regulator [Spirochaetaceae bacterium]|jgi:predicted NBD/HSP70 family sugar kinase|nr:ROK family transcriptional regulator [Spirochaetaceae bacterium]